MLFAADYKHFYCRFSDPSYVKKLKLEMLTAVANEANTYDIGEGGCGCWTFFCFDLSRLVQVQSKFPLCNSRVFFSLNPHVLWKQLGKPEP